MKQRRTTLIAALLMAVALLTGAFGATALAASGTTLTVDTVEAAPGSSVLVDVSISDNPGILGMVLKVEYDDALTLTRGVSGDAFSPLTMARPGKLESGCRFTWDGLDLSPADIKDGTILSLAFDVSADAVPGKELPISVTCIGPIDVDMNAVDVNVKNGGVKIAGDSPSVADPESLTVSKDVVDYNVGDTLSLDDLHVILNFTDKSIKTLAVSEYAVDSSAVDMSYPGVYPLKVSCTQDGVDFESTVQVRVNAVLESITASKTKTTYVVGDRLDVNDLMVMASYSGNQRKRVTTFTTNAADIDMATAGEKTLTVAYSEGDITKTDELVITVEEGAPEPLELTGIAASKEKNEYCVGDELDLSDLVVVASYANHEDVTLQASDYQVDASKVDMGKEGFYSLTVSYTEGGVTETDVVYIFVEEQPERTFYLEVFKDKTYYDVGEALNLDDLTVTAFYSDDSEAVVTDYETNAADIDMSKAGHYDLEVTYREGGLEASSSVTITVGDSDEPELMSILAIKDECVYYTGETVDWSDLEVTAYYWNKDSEELSPSDYEIDHSAYDMSAEGDYDVTISYTFQGKTATDTVCIMVLDNSEIEPGLADLESITVEKEKTEYAVGDALDIDDLLVTAHYGNGTSDIVIDYETNAASINMGVAGTKNLVVTYSEDGVKKAAVVKISVKGPEAPAKSIDSVAAKMRATTVVYSGAEVKPGVIVDGLTEGVDYYVQYNGNNTVGPATATIIGTGSYSGAVTLSFDIIPGKVALGKVKAAKKKATVKWGALKGGVKYQVQYRLGKGKWKTKSTAKAKLTIKKLKSKKKCQVRVRAYKTVGGKTYYGDWSKTKKVKIK